MALGVGGCSFGWKSVWLSGGLCGVASGRLSAGSVVWSIGWSSGGRDTGVVGGLAAWGSFGGGICGLSVAGGCFRFWPAVTCLFSIGGLDQKVSK